MGPHTHGFYFGNFVGIRQINIMYMGIKFEDNLEH